MSLCHFIAKRSICSIVSSALWFRAHPQSAVNLTAISKEASETVNTHYRQSQLTHRVLYWHVSEENSVCAWDWWCAVIVHQFIQWVELGHPEKIFSCSISQHLEVLYTITVSASNKFYWTSAAFKATLTKLFSIRFLTYTGNPPVSCFKKSFSWWVSEMFCTENEYALWSKLVCMCVQEHSVWNALNV